MAPQRGETDDLVQTAWLYHVGGLSQEEVSRRLGISRFKVLRLLAEARETGLVRVSINHETTGTLALADRLAARFGLTEVQVAPMAGMPEGDAIARRAVGILSAGFLARIGRGDAALTIGVGWGRTLAAAAEALTGLRNPKLTFVSLMGSMARTSDTSPFDVCARFAGLTGGGAMFMPAPFLADSVEDCRVILRQRMVRETLEVARRADHAIISVGECAPGALLYEGSLLTAEEAAALAAAGTVADSTGKFFRADGSLADTPLNDRAPSVDLDDLRRTDVTLVAAGAVKARAVLAVLRAGFVNRLIVDAVLGERLAAMAEGAGKPVQD
ncbi:sugar-binding transcriptional regulator [Oceaniglobus roseus]|uniref:sugar-binding transcriptional regulator n=1 Tax=Oceaniglobus roseus TaxID=1737570 RepID=UPI000C7E9345|nr:sugar-binding domain-containing protein [Kandeliimicrobium roseum]